MQYTTIQYTSYVIERDILWHGGLVFGKRGETVNLNNWRIQLRKGLLDIAVLNLLQHGRRHGYEMAQTLKQIQGLALREGNIYPVLARLQTDGLLSSNTEASAAGPPRKYFKLTEAGQEALADMNSHWDQIIESIETIRGGSSK